MASMTLPNEERSWRRRRKRQSSPTRSNCSSRNARREFVASICKDITMHATVEEEIFYPAVRAKIDDDDLMNEALVEHNSAKQLIAELERMAGDDPMLKPTVTVLQEY